MELFVYIYEMLSTPHGAIGFLIYFILMGIIAVIEGERYFNEVMSAPDIYAP